MDGGMDFYAVDSENGASFINSFVGGGDVSLIDIHRNQSFR